LGYDNKNGKKVVALQQQKSRNRGIVFPTATAFNRTIVELKYNTGAKKDKEVEAFNRTIVELKCRLLVSSTDWYSSFNRTIVELKFGNRER